MNRSEGLATQLAGDGEEARLLKIVAACKQAVTAASDALHYPSHSLLLPECRKLVNDLEMARAEREKATTALREYRRGQARPE